MDWHMDQGIFDQIKLQLLVYNQKVLVDSLWIENRREGAPLHSHFGPEIHIITEGDAYFRVGYHRDICLHAGDLIFVPGQMPHEERVKGPTRGIVFGFNCVPLRTNIETDLYESRIRKDYQEMTALFSRPDEFILTGVERLVELFHEAAAVLREQGPGCILLCQNILTRILLEIYQRVAREQEDAWRATSLPPAALPRKTVEDKRFAIVSDYMNLVCAGRPEAVEMQALADRLFMSRRQLARFLEKYYHKTFSQLVIDAKITAAKHMLLHTSLSLSEIAAQCGWAEKYFFKRFRLETGVTPKRFLRQNRRSIPDRQEARPVGAERDPAARSEE